jgi:hypothetical protein
MQGLPTSILKQTFGMGTTFPKERLFAVILGPPMIFFLPLDIDDIIAMSSEIRGYGVMMQMSSTQTVFFLNITLIVGIYPICGAFLSDLAKGRYRRYCHVGPAYMIE